MRVIVRVGVFVGGAGFVALFALQAAVALAVAPFLVAVGLATGLGTAKWLDRSWYGRQLIAGLRAGAIAVSIAAAGALVSLLSIGPRIPRQLAANSHVGGFSLASWVQSLSALSWAGIDILTTTLAAIAGVAVAALSVQVFAWSKNKRAVRIVTQARQAAQSMSRDVLPPLSDKMTAAMSAYVTGTPLMNTGRFATAQASVTSETLPPVVHHTPPERGATSGGQRRTLAPVSATPPAGISGIRRPVAPLKPSSEQPETPLTEPVLPVAASETPPTRVPSKARKADRQLTDAMRDALATWARDNDAEDAPGERSAPQPSSYLNSSPPIPKRNRKKQDTRDWLC